MFHFIADWRRGRAERKQREAHPLLHYTQEEGNTSIWLVSWGDHIAHIMSMPDRPWFDFRLRTEDVFFDRIPVPQRFYDSMVAEYGEPHVERFYEVQTPEDLLVLECPHCFMDIRESDLLENDHDQD